MVQVQLHPLRSKPRGSGYTYGNVLFANGNLFSNAGLSSAVATGASAVGAIEIVLPPEGGHGSDHETELNGKRVMTTSVLPTLKVKVTSL